MKTDKWLRLATEIFLWVMTLVIFIPLYFVVANSLKAPGEVTGHMTAAWPKVMHFENYRIVLEGSNMLLAFLNSLIYSGVSVAVSAALSAMAAFVMVRRKNRANRIILNLFLIGMIAPTNMVTTFLVMKTLGLMNAYQGMILIYSAVFMPFTVFLYNGFISNLPRDMDEAAIVDGAGPMRTFWTIIFPLLKPVTATAMILNFVNCWNDFLFPLYLTTKSSRWGVVLMLFQYTGQYASSKELLFAGAMLVILPTLVIYLLGQKHIIAGMTAGAVKG